MASSSSGSPPTAIASAPWVTSRWKASRAAVAERRGPHRDRRAALDLTAVADARRPRRSRPGPGARAPRARPRAWPRAPPGATRRQRRRPRRREGHRAPRAPADRPRSPRGAGRGSVDSPQPMRTLTCVTILLPSGRLSPFRAGDLRADRCREDGAGRGRRRAAGRPRRAAGGGVGRRPAGLPGARDADRRPVARRARTPGAPPGLHPAGGRALLASGEYADLAHAEIDGLLAQRARPIVVGGTGLYLRAALAELDPAARRRPTRCARAGRPS